MGLVRDLDLFQPPAAEQAVQLQVQALLVDQVVAGVFTVPMALLQPQVVQVLQDKVIMVAADSNITGVMPVAGAEQQVQPKHLVVFGVPGQGGSGYYNPGFAPYGDYLQPGTFASGGSAMADNGGGYAPGNVVVGGGGSMAYPTPKPYTGGGAGGQVGTGGGSGVVVIRYPA